MTGELKKSIGKGLGFLGSIVDSTCVDEPTSSNAPHDKQIGEKIWYVDFGLPIFKNIDIVFTREKPTTPNAQSFIFHFDGEIDHENVDVPTGVKYASLASGEWVCDQALFKIKYEGNIYIDSMEKNESNQNYKKTKLKRAFKGYAEFLVLETTPDRFILRKKGDAIYKEKLMDQDQ
jgi:hypothetical protein